MKKLKTLHLPISVDAKNNVAMTLERFGQLTLPQQQEVTAVGSKFGDRGSKDCDPEFVPPYCRPGVTIAQLAKMHNDGVDGIESACKKVTQLQRKYDTPFTQLYND